MRPSHWLSYEEWRAQREAIEAPGKAAEHAEHMLHAQLLAEGMALRMYVVQGNRRRELLRAMRHRAGLPVARPLPYDR